MQGPLPLYTRLYCNVSSCFYERSVLCNVSCSGGGQDRHPLLPMPNQLPAFTGVSLHGLTELQTRRMEAPSAPLETPRLENPRLEYLRLETPQMETLGWKSLRWKPQTWKPLGQVGKPLRETSRMKMTPLETPLRKTPTMEPPP